MKAIIKVLGIAIAIGAFCSLGIAQGKPDPTGTWDLTVESPQGARTTLAVLKADGEKISGTLKRQAGDTPVTGTIKGNDITLVYSIKFQDQDLKITLTGKADKDSMKGDADFGGFAQGTWSAKRHQEGSGAAAGPSSGPSAASSNVSGNWAFEVQTDQGSGSPSFTFKQEGEKLTGTYKGAFGEGPVEGTVKGSAINFNVKVNAQGQDVVITYTGTIEGGGMKGAVKLGDLGAGTWTGKRQ
jgi:hypothetical protein